MLGNIRRAIEIFAKNCSNEADLEMTQFRVLHDRIIVEIDPDTVSHEDKKALRELGFEEDCDWQYFVSTTYTSGW